MRGVDEQRLSVVERVGNDDVVERVGQRQIDEQLIFERDARLNRRRAARLLLAKNKERDKSTMTTTMTMTTIMTHRNDGTELPDTQRRARRARRGLQTNIRETRRGSCSALIAPIVQTCPRSRSRRRCRQRC